MEQKNKHNVVIAWITTAIMVMGVELLYVVGAMFSLFPRDFSALLPDVFAKDIAIIKSDWKMWVYHIVILIMITAGIVIVTRFKEYIVKDSFLKFLKVFCGVGAGIIFLETFALFFIIKMPLNSWAWGLFWGMVSISIISKIFFPELQAILWKKSNATKGFIFISIIFVMTYLTIKAPLQVQGCFLLWVLSLGIIFVVGWTVKYYRFHRRFRSPLWLTHGADVLVWLSSKAMIVNIGAIVGGLFIVSLLAIVDPLALIAKAAFGEHFYHFDFMLMAGAYVHSMGNVLGVDHNVFYGLGMPIVVASIAKYVLGSVNYVNVLNVYWWLSIFYYVAFYCCLRFWLGSVLLALAAVLLAIKWQVFYALSYPVSPIYPNGSPLRCFWDIPVLIMMWAYLKNGRSYFMYIAAIVVGFALFFMSTTGVDLYMVYLVFVLALRFVPMLQSKNSLPIYIVAIPIIAAFAFYWGYCGNSVFTKLFWQDLMYYPSLFTNGFYSVWFWDNLTTGHYLYFIVGCLIPLIYVATLLWIGLRLWRQEAKKEELITLVICVYGLSLYHHYLVLSLQNNYYMRAVPFVWVIFYWVKCYVDALSSPRRKALVAWTIAIGCAVMLLTNHLYRAYPNMWNAKSIRNPMVDPRTAYALPEDGRPYFFHQESGLPEAKKLRVNSLGTTEERMFSEWQVPDHDTLKRLYAEEFDFTQDRELIQSLTGANDQVALLSSFEIEMLRQANRRPFFFYFPLISSRGLHTRTFPHTNIYTRSMLRRTIVDLERKRPKFVFMERIFLNKELPPTYAHDHEEILSIIDYIDKNYHPIKNGQYLVAMQRNGTDD